MPQLDPEIRLKYRAQGPTLRLFHERNDFVKILIGPLGSGKTQACIFSILKAIDTQTPDAYGKRRSRILVVRNTYGDLWNTTIKDWREMTDGMTYGNFDPGDGEAMAAGVFHRGSAGQLPRWVADYLKPDGTEVNAEIIFKAFDGPEDEGAARGFQLTGIWGNELKELSKTNWDMLIGRVTRYPPKSEVPDAKFFVIGDSNAPDQDEWLGEIALKNTSDWWIGIQPGAVVRVGGEWEVNSKAENLQNLHENYYKNQIAHKKDSWVRKNLANEFVYHGTGRPVHPDFSDRMHVRALTATPGIPLYIGIDFGRTPAGVILQRQVNGQWYCLRELVTINTSALTFGRLLRHTLNQHYTGYRINATGDPAGDDMSQTRDETCLEMLSVKPPEGGGIPVLPAYTNDFERRATTLDVLLTRLVDAQPAILIDPSCTTVIKGLSGAYCFRRVATRDSDRYRDIPDKTPSSHACEALHYGLMGAGEGEDLTTETVWSEQYDNDFEATDVPTEAFE